MSQRSPGDSHGEPADDHAAAQNPQKSTPNPSTHHPNPSTSTSEYQIYGRVEGFRLEKSSRHRRSLTAGDLADGATASKFPRSERTSRIEEAEAFPWSHSCRAHSAFEAADPAEGLNAQQSARWLGKGRPGRSYAEVVREGTSARGTAARTEHQWFLSLKGYPPNTCMSPSTTVEGRKVRRRREVRFISSPMVVFFHKDSAPASIRHLSSLRSQSKPRSCLKQPNASVSESGASTTSREADAMHLLTEPAESIQIPWQPVRERYWWRKMKAKTFYSSSANHRNSEKFKEKVGDRCFNCLARGHKVAQCRDPPKCWRCGGSGHISTCCTTNGNRRRQIIRQAPHWSDDKAKGRSSAPKPDQGSDRYRWESSRRRQPRDQSGSPPPLRLNEPRGESRDWQLQSRSKEKHANKRCYSAETMHMTYSHKHAIGVHAGLEQYQYQTVKETRSMSEAILIVPQEHSPTTQQLEAWLGSVASARKTSALPQEEIKGSDDITISFSHVHSQDITSPRPDEMSLEPTNVSAEMRAWGQLWRSQHAENNASETKSDNDSEKRITKIGDQLSRESKSDWQYMSPIDEVRATTRCSDVIHIIPFLSFTEEQQEMSNEEKLGCKLAKCTKQHDNGQKSDAITMPIITASQPRLLDELHIDKVKEWKTPPTEKERDQPVAKSPSVQEIRATKSIAKKEQKKEQRCSPRHKTKLKNLNLTIKRTCKVWRRNGVPWGTKRLRYWYWIKTLRKSRNYLNCQRRKRSTKRIWHPTRSRRGKRATMCSTAE